ncbi:MAG: hypothetical protein JST30_12870 [Armatimonadetes bacterium]|nr:hypothetical protein [Armatimonadota bacterium]
MKTALTAAALALTVAGRAQVDWTPVVVWSAADVDYHKFVPGQDLILVHRKGADRLQVLRASDGTYLRDFAAVDPNAVGGSERFCTFSGDYVNLPGTGGLKCAVWRFSDGQLVFSSAVASGEVSENGDRIVLLQGTDTRVYTFPGLQLVRDFGNIGIGADLSSDSGHLACVYQTGTNNGGEWVQRVYNVSTGALVEEYGPVKSSLSVSRLPGGRRYVRKEPGRADYGVRARVVAKAWDGSPTPPAFGYFSQAEFLRDTRVTFAADPAARTFAALVTNTLGDLPFSTQLSAYDYALDHRLGDLAPPYEVYSLGAGGLGATPFFGLQTDSGLQVVYNPFRDGFHVSPDDVRLPVSGGGGTQVERARLRDGQTVSSFPTDGPVMKAQGPRLVYEFEGTALSPDVSALTLQVRHRESKTGLKVKIELFDWVQNKWTDDGLGQTNSVTSFETVKVSPSTPGRFVNPGDKRVLCRYSVYGGAPFTWLGEVDEVRWAFERA